MEHGELEEHRRKHTMNGVRSKGVKGQPQASPRMNGHVNGTASQGGGREKDGSSEDEASAVNGHTRRPLHGRKESNPLAPPFIVSAPGKTIVYGEHAVVHGKAAIAAAISLRSYLLCTTLSKSKRTLCLQFPDIGLDHTWHIPDLPWTAFKHSSRRKRYYDLVTTLDQELVDAMQPHITTVSSKAKPSVQQRHQQAASAFLYLFLSLGSENSPPCTYALRSTVPVGVGLGSSASICVCISTALLLQCRALSGPHPDQMSKEAEEQLERINRWAFVGELLIHGNPSGVDNTVATNGHAVLFQRKDYRKPPAVEILRDFPELPLLLIDTGQAKSTATEVAKVGHLKTAHPEVTGLVFDAIDSITRSAHSIVTGENPGSEASITHLGELMNVNHGLLTSLGVSHPRLERLRYLVNESGVGWTKLTGAGGGGCAITLLKPGASSSSDSHLNGDGAQGSALQELERQLEAEGFAKILLKLEHLQPSGSFKSRGVGNYCLQALRNRRQASTPGTHPENKTERKVHFYSSSGGNAGLACVHAARSLGCPATVVVPLSTKPMMVERLWAAGAHGVRRFGGTWREADGFLREVVMVEARGKKGGGSEGEGEEEEEEEGVYVPPFDHEDVWAGNSTLVEEVARQMGGDGVGVPDVVVCSVGGGGLFNGIMQGIEGRAGWEATTVLALETRGADSLAQSLEQGELITLPGITSLATSLGATRVSERTFELASKGQASGRVRSAVLTDAEAAMGCWRFADDERTLVELACGVNVALCYGGRLEKALGRPVGREEKVVIVVCGGQNVTTSMVEGWRLECGDLDRAVTTNGHAESVPSTVTAPNGV
ncbi:Mevalonate kinase [Friedmanniomyces endolithicus]|nr:Mevalonate kinase [Friedmanniomyces endolithicus]